jgi:hypothetical protein
MIFKQFWGQILLSVVVIVSSVYVKSLVANDQAGVIVATTSVVPHTYRVYSIEALIPVLITYVCHLIWPFVLDPYFTTFTVSHPERVTSSTEADNQF